MRRTLLLLLVTAALAVCSWSHALRALGGPDTPRNRAPTQAASTRSTKPAESTQQFMEKARRIAEINRELYKLFKAGKYAQCEPLLEKILQIDPENSTAWYNLACVHSRQRQIDETLRCLNKAVEFGYTEFRHMERDEDLDPIRKTDAYKKLLARKDEIQRARAQKILDQLQQKFGADYICQIDHDDKLVFATNVDRQTLEDLKKHLTSYAEAQWSNLFTHKFEQYVTVVIPKPGTLNQPMIGGYYYHPQRVLVAKTIGMTLTHEFTHALHAADQEGLGQQHPIWIIEGFATLYESSKVKDGQAVPEPNRRLNFLKRLVARKQTIPWEKFLKLTHPEFMQQAIAAYPQGRYMLMYVHDKGLLKTWYEAYTADYEADPTGAKALEKVFDKKLAQIEADWKKWVEQLPAPPLQLVAHHAYVGVRVSAVTDGLRIVQIVPGSGAEKAGLKVGDVITKIDGERMVDPDDLLLLVDAHKVGDELKIQCRRDGQYTTVAVELTAMPDTLPKMEEPAPETRPAPTTKPIRRNAPPIRRDTAPARNAA